MSSWTWILVAAVGCYLLKLAGYLVPLAWVEHPVVARATTAMTVGLLASLVAINTLTENGRIVLDSRIAGLAVVACLATAACSNSATPRASTSPTSVATSLPSGSPTGTPTGGPGSASPPASSRPPSRTTWRSS